MIDPLFIYQIVILIVLLSLLGLLLINLSTLPNAECETQNAEPANTQHATRNTQHTSHNPHSAFRIPHSAFVSVLVPARNEAANIEQCVRSLLAQDYPHFEVIVLDDQSEDGTGAILARLAAADERLRVFAGGPLRPGWLGKANACRQLAEAAMGAWLLFTDADTRHRPEMLRCTVALAQARRVGLLSMFPRQVMPTLIERLVVPLMHLAVYGLLPLPLMRRLRHPAFAAANGQFMLFTRAAYDAAGGHAAVRAQVLEDVALARAVKRAGHRVELADGGALVATRMYATPAALWAGFSKNFFAFFNDLLPFLATGLLGLALLYVLPPFWLLAGLGRAAIIGSASTGEIWAWVGLPLLQYGAGVAMRLLLAARFRFPPADALLHPLAVALQIAIGLNSARLARRGGASWKGRRIEVMSDDR